MNLSSSFAVGWCCSFPTGWWSDSYYRYRSAARKIYVKNPTNLHTLQKAEKSIISILFKQRNERATLDFDLGKEVGIDLNLQWRKQWMLMRFFLQVEFLQVWRRMPEVPGFKGVDRTVELGRSTWFAEKPKAVKGYSSIIPVQLSD